MTVQFFLHFFCFSIDFFKFIFPRILCFFVFLPNLFRYFLLFLHIFFVFFPRRLAQRATSPGQILCCPLVFSPLFQAEGDSISWAFAACLHGVRAAHSGNVLHLGDPHRSPVHPPIWGGDRRTKDQIVFDCVRCKNISWIYSQFDLLRNHMSV